MAWFFCFWHNCKANTYIFFYVYVNFLPVLHIVNSLKITKTLMYSVLTKMRYKKQNWMQGQHNGKMADFFNWPKFRLTKSVFFRARAVNRGTHVYPRMSKDYLQPLVLFKEGLFPCFPIFFFNKSLMLKSLLRRITPTGNSPGKSKDIKWILEHFGRCFVWKEIFPIIFSNFNKCFIFVGHPQKQFQCGNFVFGNKSS